MLGADPDSDCVREQVLYTGQIDGELQLPGRFRGAGIPKDRFHPLMCCDLYALGYTNRKFASLLHFR